MRTALFDRIKRLSLLFGKLDPEHPAAMKIIDRIIPSTPSG